MDGLLLINKEKGITSHDVVNRVRKIFGTRKVGHAGTLDPIAEGLLILGIDKGTRLLEYLVGLNKKYKVVMKLGEISDSYDATGVIKQIDDANNKLSNLTDKDIESAILSFEGEILQTPPIFSALKINGQRAYKLARAGKSVEMKSRKITISKIENIERDNDIIKFDVCCSSGTYIRSLVHDIGKELNIGGVMTDLCRVQIGNFDIENSKTTDDISNKDLISFTKIDLMKYFDYPTYLLNKNEVEDLYNGKFIKYKNIDSDYLIERDVFMFFEEKLSAICQYDRELNIFKPRKVFHI